MRFMGDPKSEPRKTCVSCIEDYPQSETILTKCDHVHCRECIQRLFNVSLATDSRFPPRCCHLPIQVSTVVEDMIGPKMMKKYEQRKLEDSDHKKTYCSKKTCSQYLLPSSFRRGVGFCKSCMTRTCIACKKQAHRGACRVRFDKDEELLERLARKRGWQRCYKCSQIVERTDGCSRMRCTCGTQFCYECGGQWGGYKGCFNGKDHRAQWLERTE